MSLDDILNDQPPLTDDLLVSLLFAKNLFINFPFFKTENASVEFARMGMNEQDGAEFYPVDDLQSKSSKRQFLGIDIDSIISSNYQSFMSPFTKLFSEQSKRRLSYRSSAISNDLDSSIIQ